MKKFIILLTVLITLASCSSYSIPYNDVEVKPSVYLNSTEKCTNKEISHYINHNIDTTIKEREGITERIDIDVYYIVKTNGKVKIVSISCKNPAITRNVIKVIENMPKFKQVGKHYGTEVNVMLKHSIRY